MGRKKKFDEAELIHIAQEYLLTCDMEKPTYARLSAWAKESGLDIGEHIFRAIPKIREMMKQDQQRYVAEQQIFPSLPMCHLMWSRSCVRCVQERG